MGDFIEMKLFRNQNVIVCDGVRLWMGLGPDHVVLLTNTGNHLHFLFYNKPLSNKYKMKLL